MINYANFLKEAGLVLAGMTANADILAKRGLDAEFVATYGNKMKELTTAFSEQAAMKARIMEKTNQRLALQTEMYDMFRLARKTVKLALDKESWREFGINDRW
jgi:hypothetical protein